MGGNGWKISNTAYSMQRLVGKLKHFFGNKAVLNETKKYSQIDRAYYDSLGDKEKERIASNTDRYKMTPLEAARYEAFCRDHKTCIRGIESTIGGHAPSITFIGTGLGNIVQCTCQICNATADITDIDSW